ncbi:MAG TPA: LysE family translocator [Cyclobacteriaceae bacterium]
MELQTWIIFALGEVLISFSPGPAVILVTSQAIKQRNTSFGWGIVGLSMMVSVFFLLSALGLTAFILASQVVFDVVKYAGSAYLIWVGIQMIRGAGASIKSAELNSVQSPLKLFSQGVITQASNPKTILFFVAFLPQFINPNGNIATQFIIMWITVIVIDSTIMWIYGWLSLQGIKRLKNEKYLIWVDRLSGTFLIAIGVLLGTTQRK